VRPIARGTVHDVVDHIDHIVRVAGIDHVGVGSDFDGVSTMPRQLEDVSGYPVITQRKVGTERDRAGNRRLFMDHSCDLILTALFSPAIESLRDLHRACTLDKVRKRLGVNRASLGSLPESVAIFDPAPLKEIAAELSWRAVLRRTIDADRCYILDRGSGARSTQQVAAPRLPASVLLRSQRRGDPGLPCHDRLHADPDLHGRDERPARGRG
jgi:hypothetical protein